LQLSGSVAALLERHRGGAGDGYGIRETVIDKILAYFGRRRPDSHTKWNKAA